MNYIPNLERLNIRIYIQKNSQVIQIIVIVDIIAHTAEIVMVEIVMLEIAEDVMVEQLEVGKKLL